jgi:predicted ribosomally synthesized peptide with SipW-like signal peptide
MRRRTALALGGAMTGSLLVGPGATMASFTDTVVRHETVGADVLALAVTSTEATPLQFGPGTGSPAALTVARIGTGNAVLRMSVVDGPDADACADLPTAKVTVAVPGDPNAVKADLCDLTRESAEVLLFSGHLSSAGLSVKVTVPVGQTSRVPWSGALHWTLEQQGGGFSDEQDVPAEISVPGR